MLSGLSQRWNEIIPTRARAWCSVLSVPYCYCLLTLWLRVVDSASRIIKVHKKKKKKKRTCMWHTQPAGATLVSPPPQSDALWQAYARVPDHPPRCTFSSQMPYKGSSSEALFDSSWPSFIFPSIFAKPLVCLALALPPSPASYPHLLISKSWPVGATYMALMRPSHIGIHTCKLGLYLRGTWMERDDYTHIDTYFFFSLSLILIRLWTLGRQRFFELLRPISGAYEHKPS